MMSIAPMSFMLNETHKATLQVATKQMLDLLHRVSEPHEYRLLATVDRNTLIKEGFANDLVDNLVYLTERNANKSVKLSNDKFSIGYTQAAFDASLYATNDIVKTLAGASSGKCYWCESQLGATHIQEHLVSHYRPPAGYLHEGALKRRAYVGLTYDTSNLLYTCPQCAEKNKGLQFPTLDGHHMPEVQQSNEHPVLINPRTENPRDYIRFNPLNGKAYAFDRVKGFYLQKQMDEAQIEAQLVKQPNTIPLQSDPTGKALSSPQLDAEFNAWLASLSVNEKASLSRGEESIQILNLNRHALLLTRLAHLQALWLTLQSDIKSASTDNNEQGELTLELPLLAQQQFTSLSIDAKATWWHNPHENWSAIYLNYVQFLSGEQTHHENVFVPALAQSCLMYLVLESELTLKQVRRIVMLNSHDLLYASTTSKCVFLPINWQEDWHNLVKVHENGTTWQTSFNELVLTKPAALQNLFSRSEVWAEGNYEALA
ncbi:hypothetical protein [Alteromonas sp. a30]|uniref:hypothetical protein n=1 Tax=Alteromonas sp. a30 TaxID=2730917 RepID=UPI00227DFEF0|nr:hypothetical protein [Alteromonas sp. a30]MCY7295015.1 hypothetical protein [Alteromonas sp. a30]